MPLENNEYITALYAKSVYLVAAWCSRINYTSLLLGTNTKKKLAKRYMQKAKGLNTAQQWINHLFWGVFTVRAGQHKMNDGAKMHFSLCM